MPIASLAKRIAQRVSNFVIPTATAILSLESLIADEANAIESIVRMRKAAPPKMKRDIALRRIDFQWETIQSVIISDLLQANQAVVNNALMSAIVEVEQIKSQLP